MDSRWQIRRTESDAVHHAVLQCLLPFIFLILRLLLFFRALTILPNKPGLLIEVLHVRWLGQNFTNHCSSQVLSLHHTSWIAGKLRVRYKECADRIFRLRHLSSSFLKIPLRQPACSNVSVVSFTVFVNAVTKPVIYNFGRIGIVTSSCRSTFEPNLMVHRSI